MGVAGGLNGQLGFVDEVTPGTAITVSRFGEYDSEKITHDLGRQEHTGLRTGRKVLGSNNYEVGREEFGGDLELTIQTKGQALWLKHIMGLVTTTTPGGGTTSKQHKATVGTLDGKSLSVQISGNDDAGVARPKTGAGVKVARFELSGKENDFAKMVLTLDGMSGTYATALATASYPTAPRDYFGTQCSVKIAGAEVDCAEWSLSGDNGLDMERFYMQTSAPGRKREQLEGDKLRSYSGKLTLAFPDMTTYNRYENNTQSTLQITYTHPVAIEATIFPSFDITCAAVRWDGNSPTVDGVGRIKVELEYKVIDTLATDGPLVLTMVNSDTTP